ncbi:MAG TPA: response regulator transcription factor [bacterium]|nr:response regulator transcription factor [bacterium]
MRVLLADDHALFRDGVRSLLQARGIEVVGEAADGREAVEAALRLRPDVVLMDITMPRMDGLEATRLITARAPEITIVMLTVSEDDHMLFEAIKSGAQGYLLKNLQAAEFFELLEGVQRGEAALTRSLARRILEEFGAHPRRKAADPHDELTDREREVLRAVSSGASNREVAAALHISENTVKFHMKNILDKLHLRTRAEVIAYAARRTWPLPG